MRLYVIAMLGVVELANIAAVLAGFWSLGDSASVSILVVVGCAVCTIPDLAGKGKFR